MKGYHDLPQKFELFENMGFYNSVQPNDVKVYNTHAAFNDHEDWFKNFSLW